MNKNLFPARGRVFTYRNPLLADALRMRLPTDKEYAALVRDQSSAKDDEEVWGVALELMKSLAEGLCTLSPRSANFVLVQVTSCLAEPDEAEWGERVVVRARTYGNVQTTHRFKLPALDDIFDRAPTPRESEVFYDRLRDGDAEGYAADVPLYHKHQVALTLRAVAMGKAAGVEADDFFETEATSDASTGADQAVA